MKMRDTKLKGRYPIWSTLLKLPVLGLCFLIGDCSADTDDRNFCSLSCGGAVVGSSNFKIDPSVAEWNIACQRDVVGIQEITPFTVQFKVYKEVTQGNETRKIPVPNVAITPLVNGVLGTTQTHADLQGDTRFTGIKTSPEEWCTDSCGVFTMEVVPACVQEAENQITVVASSGFVSSDPLRINVVHEVQEEEDTGAQ